jgi:hypothetical protein
VLLSALSLGVRSQGQGPVRIAAATTDYWTKRRRTAAFIIITSIKADNCARLGLLVLSTKMTNPHLAKANQVQMHRYARNCMETDRRLACFETPTLSPMRTPPSLTTMNRHRQTSVPPYDSIVPSDLSPTMSQRDPNVQVA